MSKVDLFPIVAVISIFSIIFLRIFWESFLAWNIGGEKNE